MSEILDFPFLLSLHQSTQCVYACQLCVWLRSILSLAVFSILRYNPAFSWMRQQPEQILSTPPITRGYHKPMLPTEPLNEQLLQHIACVVLDVETTGLGGNARIVEIAAIRLENWQPVAELQTLLSPGIPISPMAAQVHGIDDYMVRHAPSFADIAPGLAHLIQDAVLVGHNLFSFDLRFLVKELREVFGTGPTNWAVDTLLLARKLMDHSSHTLESLAHRLQIPLVAHHAMSDVYATAELWMHLVRVLMRRGGKQLLDVSRFGALKQLDGSGIPRFSLPPYVRLQPRS